MCGPAAKLAILALLSLLLISGCGNKKEMPLYGNWEGRFQAGQESDEDMKGYLQLYATNHKFKMRLGNKSQNYDTLGDWTIKGNQILLNIQDMTFGGLTQKEAEGRKMSYVAPTDVRSAYGHTLILNLATDGKTLNGLPMALGAREGTHIFHKTEHSSYK